MLANNEFQTRLTDLPQEPIDIILHYVSDDQGSIKKVDNIKSIAGVNKFFYDSVARFEDTDFGKLLTFSILYFNQIRNFDKLAHSFFRQCQRKVFFKAIVEFCKDNKLLAFGLATPIGIFSGALLGIRANSGPIQEWDRVLYIILGLAVALMIVLEYLFWKVYEDQTGLTFKGLWEDSCISAQLRCNDKPLSPKYKQILQNMKELDLIMGNHELIDLPESKNESDAIIINIPNESFLVNNNKQTADSIKSKREDLEVNRKELAAHINKVRFSDIPDKGTGLSKPLYNAFMYWKNKTKAVSEENVKEPH